LNSDICSEVLETDNILVTPFKDIIASVESKEMSHITVPKTDFSTVGLSAVHQQQITGTHHNRGCRSSASRSSPSASVNRSGTLQCPLCRTPFFPYAKSLMDGIRNLTQNALTTFG